MTVNLPDEVAQLLNDPKSVKILTTVAADGTPHSIRVGSMGAPAPNLISVGAILMKTSNANLEVTKKAKKLVCILVNSEMKAFLITATVKEDLTSGPLFDGTNAALKPIGMAARSVWTFEPMGVWDQSANYNAGKKIA
ncbi:MAG: hypothetical protein ABR986_03710 [Methanomassiliicoccales archaeon]|jgi:hypothetical protein